MKRISSNIAAIAILGTMATGSLFATDNTWDVATTAAKGGTHYGAQSQVELNLGGDWTQDSRFTFNIHGGSLPDGGTILVCNGAVEVARLINDEDLSSLIFQMNDDVQNEIREDENLTFVDGKEYSALGAGVVAGDLNCSTSTFLTIIPTARTINDDSSLASNCVTVSTTNGADQSGTTNIPQMNTLASGIVAEYQEEIMISCTPPVCTLNNARTDFVDTATASGVNLRLAVNEIDFIADRNETSFDGSCYWTGCGITAATAGSETNCTTVISVRNNLVDHNVSGFTLATALNGIADAVATSTDAASLSIPAGTDANLSVTFTIPAGSTASIGDVTGTLSTFTGLNADLTTPATVVSRLANVATTEFTVTYMNPNSKAFAKITAKNDTTLYAKVTDQKGNSVNVEFTQGIKAGQTAFVFVDAAGSHGYDLDALVTAAGGLPGNGWTVDFSTNTAVDVAAYMQTANGERTLTVLYPEYTAELKDTAGVTADSSMLNPN